MKIVCDLYSATSQWGIFDPRALSKFRYAGLEFWSVEQVLLYSKLLVYGYDHLAHDLIKKGEYYTDLFPEIEKAFDDGPIRSIYEKHRGYHQKFFELYHLMLHYFIMATVAKIEQADGILEKINNELLDVWPVQIEIADVVKSEASKSNFCYLLSMNLTESNPKGVGFGRLPFSAFLDAGYGEVFAILKEKRVKEILSKDSKVDEETMKKDSVDEE